MKRLTVILLSMMFTIASYAQGAADAFGAPPPQPDQYGKCYAKCKTPDVYETVSTQVLVKESRAKSTVSDSEYETVTETVLVKDGYKKLTVIPAKFETKEQRVLVSEGSCKVSVVPAKYDTQTTRELVSPASGKWVKKKKAPNCLSANPEDCYVLCWEEIPAQYKTNSTSILIQPESYDTIYTDPVYKTIKVQVMIEPARVEEEYVPPVYKEVTKKVLARCGGVSTTYTPAEYKTETKKVLVAEGSYTDWVEVVCAGDMDNSMVSGVQKALNDRGYDAGPVDGVMGAKTRAALVKYQQDNGLPVGNLNIATLQSLGLK